MRSVFTCFFFLGLVIGLSSCSNPQNFKVAPAAEAYLQNVTYNNKVDLLWVVDNSRSMSQHQQNLSAQFGSFIDILYSKKIDFRIAITTMDMSASGEKGRFVGTPKVISSSTANARAAFQANIQVGENGSDVERGFEAMAQALSESRLANENTGFLRDDAQLAVIFVTNEEDHSSGRPSDYAAILDRLKPGNSDEEPPRWMANFIGITAPNGVCFTRGDIADPGDRYMELTRSSNGQIAEICANDLSSALSSIRQRIVERLVEFRLSSKPVVSSIIVRVNNQLIVNEPVNGWTYEDRSANNGGYVIRFHGASVPAADAKINIDYTPSRE